MTYHRKNIQPVQLCASDEYHLKQRNKIETLFSLLKGQYNLVTSKARSIRGFLSGIYASLWALLQITTNGKLKTVLAKGAAYESFPWSAFSGRNHSLGCALVL